MKRQRRSTYHTVHDVRDNNSLGVQPTHGQSKPEPSDRAQTRFHPLARNLTKEAKADPVTATDCSSAHTGPDCCSPTDVLRGVWPTARPNVFVFVFAAPGCYCTTVVPASGAVAAGAGAGSAAGAAAGGGECVGEDA